MPTGETKQAVMFIIYIIDDEFSCHLRHFIVIDRYFYIHASSFLSHTLSRQIPGGESNIILFYTFSSIFDSDSCFFILSMPSLSSQGMYKHNQVLFE
jgi:hypothetical protein